MPPRVASVHISGHAFRYLLREPPGGPAPETLGRSVARKTRRFHRRLPGYTPTPLVALGQLARTWGLAGILVKDEASRFGLGAFKALGGSYAVARLVCARLGWDIDTTDYRELIGDEARRRLGRITLATATDGNHGRGVAWAAQQIGQSAVVFMPQGSAAARVDSIRDHGARVVVTDLNYDDTVRLAWRQARKHGWEVVQDTAWEGYRDIPRWIMQGYLTLVDEAADQMSALGRHPTHVFLQAGVGAFAGTMTAYLVNRYPDNPPRIIIMEPNAAACLLASAASADGQPQTVGGDLATIMAGLACGEPHPAAWDILRTFACGFLGCPDFTAANGMRILAHPLAGDPAVEAGESGAVGLGVLDLLMNAPSLAALKHELGLGPDATPLLFNTEGATDPANYRRILWYGRHPHDTAGRT